MSAAPQDGIDARPGGAIQTLGSRLARADASHFVGRTAELETFDRVLTDRSSANVVFVHGPSGIGKSALLREFARRGEQAGWTTRLIEGREIPPLPGELERALGGVWDLERPLLVFDTYERMSALGGYLRQKLLPSLPAQAVVIIASRRPPEPEWAEAGWDRLAVELELDSLDSDAALDLLSSLGLDDPSQASRVQLWAGGSPLALTLAASAVEHDHGWLPRATREPRTLVRRLIARLIDAEIDIGQASALAVAAIARVTTVDLLRSVLPDVDATEAMQWLGSRSFAEHLSDGVILHDAVGLAVAADLAHRDPEHARELRHRIADYTHARAAAGNPRLAIDLAHLIESDVVRGYYGAAVGDDFRIDTLRAGDAARIAPLLARRGLGSWWPSTERFFREAPERVAIARDADDRACGYLITMSVASAPPWVGDDPIAGRWCAHARTLQTPEAALIWRDSIDFTPELTGERLPRIQGLLGMAGTLRGGLANPRYLYVPIDSRDDPALRFAHLLGATEVPSLHVDVGRYRIAWHCIDCGPGGILGFQRDHIYRELGLAPPAARDTAAAPTAAPEVTAEVVRDALRSWHQPLDLARSPLARGTSPAERAASVRHLLEDASQNAFGDSHSEQLMRQILTRGYLGDATSHEVAAEELHVSRTTYYRQLRRVAQRIAEYLSARQEP